MKKELLLLTGLICFSLLIYILAPYKKDNSFTEEQSINENVEQSSDILTQNFEDKSKETLELSFDIVRLSPDGNTIIAGKTSPNLEIEIFEGNTRIGSALSDSNGEWIWVGKIPLQRGIKRFSLKHMDKSGFEFTSHENVIIFLEGKTNELPKIVRFSSKDNYGIKILNNEEVLDGLAIDLVEYTPENKIILKGRSNPSSLIKIFLDNNLYGEVVSDETGYWEFITSISVFKSYDLKVLSNIKNQEIKLSAKIFEENIEKKLFIEKNVIVETGNSLWRIARKLLGGGIYYSEIYKNNVTKIDNPDLIYPGQVFNIPLRKN